MIPRLPEEPDYLPISMLNQIAYCERRFWLMYVCGEMEVNASVLEGTFQHERVHNAGRGDAVEVHRRVYLWSDRLRIAGFADLVEERLPCMDADALRPDDVWQEPDPTGLPWFEDKATPAAERVLSPVEYKHGRKGRWDNDRIQLCAQALCLEERTGRAVPRGAIFYWRSRRRVEVEFTAELRAETEATIARAFALLVEGRIPPPVDMRSRCRGCSLEGICLPREVQELGR